MNHKPIKLFYWSEKNIRNKDFENYGDVLSGYLVEKISKKNIEWVQPRRMPWYNKLKKHYLVTGSIIHHGISSSIIWGSGVISKDHLIPNANYLAVRGPLSRKLILDKGYQCPEVYGDPAILLPNYFQPDVPKKYKIGIIPHHMDYDFIKDTFADREDIKVLNLLTNNVEAVTAEILKCEKTVSSSLHGLIVSHAYKIPSKWVKFSNKLYGDDIKFQDYFASVQIPSYDADFLTGKLDERKILDFSEVPEPLPDPNIIMLLKARLMDTCPF